jgi:MtrB/PioB family decaheme-associated outer membrane protein
VKANVRQEKKEGLKLQGGLFGNSGGNPRSILIPEPVDYETTHVDLALGYADERVQLQGSYYLSLFRNAHDSVRWQNPYTQIAGWTAASAGFPTGIGELALPPDNQFHQLSLGGGYNFSRTTRLGFNVALGRMTQDESFLPYAATPGITIHTPLPRASLDGKVNTTLVNLNFSTRPIRDLTLRGSYRFDDRNDRTPQAQYIYIGGDSQSPQDTVASVRARTNIPLSYRQNLAKLDADYQVFRGTKLSAGYDYDEIRRKNTEVGKTRENTVRLGARHTLSEAVSGNISYAHSRRRHDEYVGNRPFLLGHSPEYAATRAPGLDWDNNPLLRKFTYANRDRDKLRFNVTASPIERFTLGLSADYYDDDYKDTLIGLQEARGTAYTLDAAFVPMERVTTYAFYTRDEYKSQMQNRSFNTAQKPIAGTAESFMNDWWIGAKNTADTYGIGFKTTGFRERLDFGADLFYTRTTGHINPTAGPGLPVAFPLPDNRTRLRGVELFGKYRVTKNFSTRVSLLRQKYNETDWAWDNVRVTEMANVISTGQVSPSYSVTALGVSVIYNF